MRVLVAIVAVVLMGAGPRRRSTTATIPAGSFPGRARTRPRRTALPLSSAHAGRNSTASPACIGAMATTSRSTACGRPISIVMRSRPWVRGRAAPPSGSGRGSRRSTEGLETGGAHDCQVRRSPMRCPLARAPRARLPRARPRAPRAAPAGSRAIPRARQSPPPHARLRSGP